MRKRPSDKEPLRIKDGYMVETSELAVEGAAALIPGQEARVFARDQASLQIIKGALADIGIKDPLCQLGDVATACAVLAKTSSPRLLIVDISATDDPFPRLSELANICDPDVNVVAFGERNDIVLYRDLKNMGVTEYFVKPLVKGVVTRICRNVLNPGLEQPKMRTGKLILVVGVRGGVGATTIATHTAWHLSGTGRRRVVLLDLDLKHGDTSLQFDIAPSNALYEAMEFPDRVDQLFLDRAVQPVSDRLHVLASLAPLTQSPPVTAENVASLLQKLAAQYRYVVVDLPKHLAAEVIHSTLLPRVCLLVSSASLTSARDVARWREQIGTNILERSTMHVLNRTEPSGGLPDKEFIRAAGQPADVSIAYHRDLAEAATLGIRGTTNCTGFIRSLQNVLNPLTGEHAEAPLPFYRRLWG
jgi:pilus assembly protein CpaE